MLHEGRRRRRRRRALLRRRPGEGRRLARGDRRLPVRAARGLALPARPRRKHEDELIIPAREGTLRVLRAARARGRGARGADLLLRRHRLRPAPRGARPSMSTTGPTSPRNCRRTSSPRPWPSAPPGTSWPATRARSSSRSSTPSAVFGPVLGADFSTSIGILQGHARGSAAGLPRSCISAWWTCATWRTCTCAP